MTTTKPHECRYCHRSLARSEHLKRNIKNRTELFPVLERVYLTYRADTNEKPFRCPCGKAFTRKDLLKRHEQVGRHWGSSDASTPTQSSDSSAAQHGSQESSAHGRSGEATVSDVSLLNFESETLPDIDVFDSEAFHNFDSFISTMGMNMPFEMELFGGGLHNEPTPAPSGRTEMLMLHRHPDMPNTHESYQCRSVATGARSLEFADADADELAELRPMPCPWGFSTLQREELQTVSTVYQTGTEVFRVPSRLGLGRYIAAYFDEFHNHFPCIHATTFRPQALCATAPELVLAIAACGAVCKYEVKTAVRIWHVARRITLAKWTDSGDTMTVSERLRTAQAATLLTHFAILYCKSR